MRRLPSTGVINAIWALGDALVLRVPKDVDEARSDTLTESVPDGQLWAPPSSPSFRSGPAPSAWRSASQLY